jgi:hypothetical protein
VNLLLVFNALSNRRKKNDFPTIKLKSSPQGVVKLRGKLKALEGNGFISPIFGVPCIAYKSEIFENHQSIFKSYDNASAVIECHEEVAFIPFYMLEDKDLFYVKSAKQNQINPLDLESIFYRLGLSKKEFNPNDFVFEEEVIFENMDISILGFFKSLSSTMEYLEGFNLINGKPKPVFFNGEKSLQKLINDWNLFKKHVMNTKNIFSTSLYHAFFEHNASLPIIKDIRNNPSSILTSTLFFAILLWSITIYFLYDLMV